MTVDRGPRARRPSGGSGRTVIAHSMTPPSAPQDEHAPYIEAQIEKMRERLLDLTSRNTLLNFKHPVRSRTQVRVIDEVPEVLYQRLVAAKSMRFKPVDEFEDKEGNAVPLAVAMTAQGLASSFELPLRPTAGALPKQHEDSFIQLPYFRSEMTRRLDAMRLDHQSSIQELGVPSLFAVFGFLEWYEREEAKVRLSPLVLVPISLERERVRGSYEFSVAATSDEPEPNRTLQFRIFQDFGLRLPPLDDLADDEALDAYLDSVAAAIAPMARWRVHRMVTVANLSFARQVMYEDLAPERWAAYGGRQGSLVRALLGGVGVDALTTLQPLAEPPLLITEADSTQNSAIAEALAGRSMVIKGPPGTGKSQTITNLIAAALAANKRVLFVAEKMAALEVVKKRLDDAGLAPFCLSLHSTRAGKREVLAALEQSIKVHRDPPRPPAAVAHRLEEQRLARMEVEQYLRVMAMPVGQLGLPLRELVWQEQALRGELGELSATVLGLAVPGANRLTLSEVEDGVNRLAELERAMAEPGSQGPQSAWRFVGDWDVLRHTAEGVRAAVTKWHDALGMLPKLVAEQGWPVAGLRVEDFGELGAQLADLQHVEAAAPSALVAVMLSSDQYVAEALTLADDLEHRAALLPKVRRLGDIERLLPERERIDDAVRALQTAGLTKEELPLRRIAEQLAEHKVRAQGLEAAANRLHALARGMTVPEPWVLEAQRVTLECGAIAFNAGAGILRHRTLEILEIDSVASLTDARHQVAALRAKRVEHDRVFNGWASVSSAELREHAMVLRTTGLFGRMFGQAFKAARLKYLAMTTGRVATREEMANAFEASAVQLESEQRFLQEHALLWRACGSHARGLDTNFDALIEAAAWGSKIRDLFTRANELTRWARMQLFTAEAEQLLELGDFVHERCELLRKVVSGGGDIAAVAKRTLREIGEAEHALAQMVALGVNFDLRPREVTEYIVILRQVAQVEARIAASRAKEWLGAFWRGASTQPRALRAAVTTTQNLRDIAFPGPVATWLLGGEFSARVPVAIAVGRALLDAVAREQHARLVARGEGVMLAELVVPGASAAEIAMALKRALDAGHEALARHLRYVVARSGCGHLAAAAGFCRAFEQAGVYETDLARKFALAVRRTLIWEVLATSPQLAQGQWGGVRLNLLCGQILALEHTAVTHRRARLAAQLAAIPVPQGRRSGARRDWTDVALIQNEVGKTTRHIPLRSLVKGARDAVLALTPCLMMSPLSIAQYLEDPTLQFDLLIVDEASQLRPEEAIGALLRARQVVVVGDEQQLPPTNFFGRRRKDDEDEASEEEVEEIAVESLLELAMETFGAPRVLRWHYRSRHESLIGFSNEHFYKNELIVAPAPSAPGPGVGVRLEKVKGLYGSSINEVEAERVVAIVAELMRTGKRSIGVVAVNQQQADLIQEIFDKRVQEPQLKYVDEWKASLEPFFIKSLENVQGDERDVIVISLTFGPKTHGSTVHQTFGPIAGVYGHRRLNVLFSRAKHQLVLVTSMDPADVRAETSTHQGPKILRAYLEYAANNAVLQQREPDENVGRIAREVADLGFDVVSAVGAQGLRLDFGVRHPSDPSRFIAAVDVDAGDDVSPAAATDRELVRPVLLERLGWTVIPTWTVDWVREPATARMRLREGLEHACRSANLPLPPPKARVVATYIQDAGTVTSVTAVAPPTVTAQLVVDGRPVMAFEAAGARIRIGRAAACDIRIPDRYDVVAAVHFELRWEAGGFSMVNIDKRSGVFIEGARRGPGVLARATTHTIRLGLSNAELRIVYGGELEAFARPAAGGEAAPATALGAVASAPVSAVLDPATLMIAGVTLEPEEREFLLALTQNKHLKTSDLTRLLNRNAIRVNGMARLLKRKLHEAGAPAMFTERSQDGETVFERVGS